METIVAARPATSWQRLRTWLWRTGWFIPTFFALLATPGLVQLVSRAPTDMGAENRRPAPPPVWPDTRAAIIGFPAAADAWLADSFGVRNDLVRLNTVLRWRLFGEVSAKRIIVGRHGRLFLGSHDGSPPQSLVTVVCGANATETLVTEAVSEIRHSLDVARSVGLQPTLLIVPTAARLYAEDLPPQLAAACAGHTPLGDAVAARLSGEPVIYPLAEMLRLKQETEVIPRHRFHWAGLAPLRIAELVAETHWGLPRSLHLGTMRKTRDSDLNPLSPGLELADMIDEPQLIAAGVQECWFAQCSLDGVPAASLRAESAYSRPGDGKLLIISDSFGDEIGPDFVEQFGDVWMVSINSTPSMTVAERKVFAEGLLRKFGNGRVLFVVHDFGTVAAFDRLVADVLTP